MTRHSGQTYRQLQLFILNLTIKALGGEQVEGLMVCRTQGHADRAKAMAIEMLNRTAPGSILKVGKEGVHLHSGASIYFRPLVPAEAEAEARDGRAKA